MRRHRVVVGFQLIETPEMRMFRHAWNQMSVDEILAEPRIMRQDTYWCAADKPERQPVVPIYPGTKLPDDARCVECHMPLAELQAEMKRYYRR